MGVTMAHPRIRWVAAALGVVVAATTWGLAVSIGSGTSRTVESELPDIGFEREHGRRERVVQAEWGSGDGRVGMSTEGEAVGPNSFGVDDRGRVYVLDQVNRRVVRFLDGEAERSYPLPDSGFDDVAVRDGRLAVLSRLDGRRVLLFDAETGEQVASLPIAEAVPPIHRLTLVGDEVCVQCSSADSVSLYAIGTLKGDALAASEQARVRHTDPVGADGTLMRAARLDESNVRIGLLDGRGAERRRIHVRSPRRVASIIEVRGDRLGNTYLIYALYKEDGGEPNSVRARMVCAKYSPEGELLGRAEMPNDGLPTEPQRKVVVTDGGDVYQMDSEKAGITVMRWTLVE